MNALAAVVAVVGVAKNCGKTTTLNYLVEQASAAGRIVGLVSIGIDGESQDALLGTPKPPIHVAEGQLVVTAQGLLDASSARVEYLESFRFTTPLGDVVMVRVLEAGEILLGGMRHRADVSRAVDSMQAAGADQIFIDGAYGRIAAAAPGLADGVVVATGAVISPRVATIVEKTASMVTRLTFPEIELPWQRKLMEAAEREARVLLGGPDIEPIELPSKSALLGLSRGRDRWTPEVEAVAVPGLVSDRVVQEILRHPRGGTLLLSDGTVFQADEKLARRLSRNWDVCVLRTCSLAGIAFNPTSLRGNLVSGAHLGRSLRARFPKIPVFDPIVGIE